MLFSEEQKWCILVQLREASSSKINWQFYNLSVITHCQSQVITSGLYFSFRSAHPEPPYLWQAYYGCRVVFDTKFMQMQLRSPLVVLKSTALAGERRSLPGLKRFAAPCTRTSISSIPALYFVKVLFIFCFSTCDTIEFAIECADPKANSWVNSRLKFSKIKICVLATSESAPRYRRVWF